jgi:predicted phage terminase large subunit-like protein
MGVERLSLVSLVTFSEYVFGDRNASFHDEWFRLLERERARRLLILAPRSHAKTTCVSVKYPLWRLGRDTDLRILIVGKTATVAESILREIKGHIEGNLRYQQLFPGLKPGKPEKWTDSEIIVRRRRIDKNPSISALGLHGSVIGRRADLIICDDIIDEANVTTQHQRAKVETWFNKVLMPVLEPYGQVIVVGTRWHYADLYARLMENPEYQDPNPIVLQCYMEDAPIWPERWSREDLEAKRREIGSLAFNCQYMNDPSGLEGILFKGEWLHYYVPAGAGVEDPDLVEAPEELLVYQGVDPAISERPEADYTCIVTIGVDPESLDVYMLDVVRMHLDFPAQMKLIGMKAAEHRPVKIGVESNAYQRALSRMGYIQGLPVVEVHTHRDRLTRMIGLAPHFENGRIRLPLHASWLDDFVEEYLSYPRGAHDDQLDALDIAVEIGVSGGPIEVFGAKKVFK